MILNNQYRTMRKKHQAEVDSFPMFFAFNNEQFEQGMRKFGLNPTDADQIYRLGGTGGFYRKSDSSRLAEMFERQEAEFQTAIAADSTGEGFIFEMFNEELANHEYVFTRDVTETLNIFCLTADDIKADSRLSRGLEIAIEAQEGGTNT